MRNLLAVRAGHATTRSPRYALGPGVDLPIARVVALLLVLVAVCAVWLVSNVARSGPSQEAVDIANFNPKTMFSDPTPHFLPTPIAALAPESNAGPPAPAAAEEPQTPSVSQERVKVANTGGVGAILRADPPRGRQVAALRDGTTLEVIEHQQLPDGSEWLHVKSPDGVEGWIFSRLVAPTS